MKRASLLIIRIYQRTVGPVFGIISSCRYQPTCSEYGYGVIAKFGFRHGWWMALRRIARCNPFYPAGHDPIPDRYISWREAKAIRRQQRAPKKAAL